MRAFKTRRATPADRFWAKVDKADDGGCWLWTAGTAPFGYGMFWVDGRTVVAHRWLYESLYGPVASGLHLDHLCRVPACVNPSHLEPVSPRENTLRGMGPSAQNAVKTSCLWGHAYDAANTYLRPDGSRDCRACRRERTSRFHARKVATA